MRLRFFKKDQPSETGTSSPRRFSDSDGESPLTRTISAGTASSLVSTFLSPLRQSMSLTAKPEIAYSDNIATGQHTPSHFRSNFRSPSDPDSDSEREQDRIPIGPPTPDGGRNPILLPNELVLQIFGKKLCSKRETPSAKVGFFSSNEPEYFHTYLTKKGIMGSLWITSERVSTF